MPPVDEPQAAPARALRTQLAVKALDLADTFNVMLGSPFRGWRAELSAPGMSTAGGKQALQHIGLSPEHGGATIVIGTVDRPASRVELRSYERVDSMHRKRFERPFPVAPTDYERYVSRVSKFLNEDGLTVTIESEAKGHPSQRAGSSIPVLWVILGVLLLALVGAAISAWLFLRGPGASQGVPLPPMAPVTAPELPLPAPQPSWQPR